MATASGELHRHHDGEHVEDELRYYRPKRFTVPDTLAELTFAGSRVNPHLDRYFEAVGPDGPLLRAGKASLRVREKAGGEVLATFKRKVADKGARARRAETEDALTCPRCDTELGGCEMCANPAGDNYAGLLAVSDCVPVSRAREATGDAPFAFMFAVANGRVDHHFRDELTGAHVVLSEDELTYSDGSGERRVEVEYVAGDGDLLDRIDADLRGRYPKLKVCKRGKLSEGRRRHAAMLGALVA